MRVIFTLGHPAHFHLFKNVIGNLLKRGHQVKIAIIQKDILEDLLIQHGYDYEILEYKKNKKGVLSRIKKLFNSSIVLYRITKSFAPDLMIGCLSQMSWVGFLKHVPTIFCAEDDITYTRVQCNITYPFATVICTPFGVNVGRFSYKRIPYSGYQKISYLHPNVFVPDKSRIDERDLKQPFFIIRLVNLTAHHDVNIQGLSGSTLTRLISFLKTKGTVYISSENELHGDFADMRLPYKLSDIHHVMYFSSLFIGDSQSMAVEAAILGVPNIRYNDFAGKSSVLYELEHKYGLTYAFNTQQSEEMFEKVKDLLNITNLKEEFQRRRKVMLSDKIDVCSFLTWLIENYPDSVDVMKNNSRYQYNFK